MKIVKVGYNKWYVKNRNGKEDFVYLVEQTPYKDIPVTYIEGKNIKEKIRNSYKTKKD